MIRRGHGRYRVVGVGIGFLLLGAVLGLLVGSSGQLTDAVVGLSADRGDEVARLRAERDGLAADARAADAFAERAGPVLVRSTLPGTAVTLVSVGGDPADTDAVARLVGQAGGRVAGEVRLTPAVTDPARADQLRDLAARLLPAGAQLPASSEAGTLTGGLLGSALLTAPGSAPPAGASAQSAQTVLAGLSAAGFAEQGAAPAPASLAVVVTGGAPDGVDAAGVASTTADLVSELDRRGGGAVLAGRSGSDAPTGPVGVLRAAPDPATGPSTVDDVQSGPGRVATVLAAAEQTSGRSGHYGSAPSATAPLPAARP